MRGIHNKIGRKNIISMGVVKVAKLFDLNIERVLEHWDTEHAIREIIANAIDEQSLTGTKDIEVYKLGTRWYIRDFGRGIEYRHFIQSENEEKLRAKNVIGKFGVGLKDALAVFHRAGIGVEINSKHWNIRLAMAQKPGFDIQTLHAVFNDPIDLEFVGTEFILDGVLDTDIEMAKSKFLYFNTGLRLLESTKYGEVYAKGYTTEPGIIYINGVQVATEANFLYSYNITNVTKNIKRALSRDRMHVGRAVYSEVIKVILSQCISDSVLIPLINDIRGLMRYDESSWVDVAAHVSKELNDRNKVVFMTLKQREELSTKQLEVLEASGRSVVLINDGVYRKISRSVVTIDTILRDYDNKFKYKFIQLNELCIGEREVFKLSRGIVDFLRHNGFKYNIAIKISETMGMDSDGIEMLGVYDKMEDAIIIKRSVLKDKTKFCAILLHEFAHYQHNYGDNTGGFETDLMDIMGKLYIGDRGIRRDSSTKRVDSSKSLFRLLLKLLYGKRGRVAVGIK